MELFQSKVSVDGMIKAMDICFQAGMTPVFIGESGIGKTYQIRAYAEMKNWGMVENNCANMFVEDFGAIRDNGEFIKFKLNEIFSVKKPTLMFFDEFSRSRGDLRNAVMSVINERKIYGVKLNDHLKFAVAMNPATADYGDTDDPFVDLATTRRYTIFNVIHHATDWLKWAEANNVDDRVIRFIRKNESMLLVGQACPRQWVKISNVLKAGPDIDKVRFVSEGTLGIAHRYFIEHLLDRKIITAMNVLQAYAKVREEVIKDRQLQMALAGEIATKNIEKKYKVNLITFMVDLPEEIRYQTIKTIVDNCEDNQRDIIYEWIDSNDVLKDFMEKQSDY